MAVLKITKRNVDAAPKPEKTDAYFWDTDLRGFGLRVTKNGVRSYVLQYRLPGRPARRMTIGIHGSPWTPEKARSRAEEILMDVKRGDDPIVAAKKRARAAVDLEFAKYVETFTDGYLKHEWKDAWGDGKRQLSDRGRSFLLAIRLYPRSLRLSDVPSSIPTDGVSARSGAGAKRVIRTPFHLMNARVDCWCSR